MSHRRLLTPLASVWLVTASACIDTLDPAELGLPRVFGTVRGEPPMSLLPPLTDRSGNIYVVHAGDDHTEVATFIGHAETGWSSDCVIKDGDALGMHGWIGATDDHAWFWSGEALIELQGATGGCQRVLQADPLTGTDLAFTAVLPALRETTTRTTVVALVRGPTDKLPFVAVIDLDIRVPIALRPLSPTFNGQIAVLGVGGVARSREGVVLLAYRDKDTTQLELRTYDHSGTETAIVPVGEPVSGEPPSVVGMLQLDPDGLLAGLLSDKRLLLAQGGTATLVPITDMQPVGVHRHDDSLYLVGTVQKRPALAPIRDASAAPAVYQWTTSEAVASTLAAGGVAVLDDHTGAREVLRWDRAVSAIGTSPFLSPHDLNDHALGVSGWVLGGPSFSAGGNTVTQLAHVPIGVEYR
jgi:hypothetical protein